MTWHDHTFDGTTPTSGRVLVRPDRIAAWLADADMRANVTWLVELDDVAGFLAALPPAFQPPRPGAPHNGLPMNVWVGGPISKVWPDILDVRSRIRFLILDEPDVDLADALAAWRCSSCGSRGMGPRPRNCPRVTLCGDAPLLPQIHWIVASDNDETLSWLVKQAGAKLWPTEIPE